MKEQRRNVRTEVAIEIRIHWLEKRYEVTTTFNYSDGGILAKNPFSDIPETDTPMTLQVTTLVDGVDAPVLPVKVIRATRDQIAFKFTFDTV